MAAMSSAAEENDVGREYVVAAVAAGCGALLASASAQSLSPSRLLVLRPCHPSNATAAMCASPPSLITSVFVEMHHRSADGPWCMSTQTQSRTDSGVTCTPTADLPLRSSFVERKKTRLRPSTTALNVRFIRLWCSCLLYRGALL